MNLLKRAALSIALLLPVLSFAQAPSGAPSGSTGQCKDGSYSSAPSKRGACSGHQGVKDWYAADAAAPAATTKTAPVSAAPATAAAPAPAAAPMPKTATATPATPKAPAAGGGAGQVWVNKSSQVYHCPGTRYYGTTKAGEYMTEAAAKSSGARADHGKACTS